MEGETEGFRELMWGEGRGNGVRVVDERLRTLLKSARRTEAERKEVWVMPGTDVQSEGS